MIQKKLQAWRPFFHLLSVSGIPWIWYLQTFYSDL